MRMFWLCVLCLSSCTSNAQDSASACSLAMKQYTFEYKYSQEGDIIIGGIFTVHPCVTRWKYEESPYYHTMCAAAHRREYRHLRAFIFAINEINRNPDILPNITLGYHVYDSCGSPLKSIKDVIQIMSGFKMNVPNYSCMGHGNVAGFIGDLNSVTTFPMAKLLSLFGYTQISYGTRDPRLSSRKLYPHFFRTVTDDSTQYVAIAQLLKRFGWNWVGVITSKDEIGMRAVEHINVELSYYEIYIIFKLVITSNTRIGKAAKVLCDATTDVFIVCGTNGIHERTFFFRASQATRNKTFILTASWARESELVFFPDKFAPMQCPLVISSPVQDIPGMQTFLDSPRPSNNPDDMLLEDIWITEFQCLSANPMKNVLYTLTTSRSLHNCTREDVFSQGRSYHSDGTPYHVYIAVLSMAQALHDMNLVLGTSESQNYVKVYKYKLIGYVKQVYYRDPNGKEIFFNEKRELPEDLYIINWVKIQRGDNEGLRRVYVGYFNASLPEGQQLIVDPSRITWVQGKEPNAKCSIFCLPGFRTSPRKGYPEVCHECVQCPEGEISNVSDSKICEKCPDSEWPNEKKDICIPRETEFLSYEDDFIAVLFSVTSLVFSVITVFVIGTFLFYQDTPIVRANNRNLSFILLTTLKMSLLCVFLFLGHPADLTCKLRQVFFGIIFTVVLSSVLAKTIIVCIAFKATEPGSVFRKWVGSKLAYSVVIICSSVQVLHGVIWLSISPPFQEFDIDSYPGKIIIQCNKGSSLAFYLMLGYMGLLAAVSLILAFMVRTLPDTFNEAKYITFSMLVFCSVWICAIPAYLSSKGKHVVSVEVFAILASSIGILSCMFFPKCYNILLRPEMNSIKQMLKIKS